MGLHMDMVGCLMREHPLFRSQNCRHCAYLRGREQRVSGTEGWRDASAVEGAAVHHLDASEQSSDSLEYHVGIGIGKLMGRRRVPSYNNTSCSLRKIGRSRRRAMCLRALFSVRCYHHC